jgi:hypothetical protein
MTLTPDASRPEDNDKLRKDDTTAAQDSAVSNGYGYDNVGNTLPATPENAPQGQNPYAAPQAPNPSYGVPQSQYPGYVPPGNVPAGNQGAYYNPAGQVPQNDMWSDAKKPENASTIFGASSIALIIFSFIVGPFVIASPILAIFGILQANKANRFGVPATLGKVLSWVGLGLNLLGIIIVILFAGFFLTLMATSGS